MRTSQWQTFTTSFAGPETGTQLALVHLRHPLPRQRCQSTRRVVTSQEQPKLGDRFRCNVHIDLRSSSWADARGVLLPPELNKKRPRGNRNQPGDLKTRECLAEEDPSKYGDLNEHRVVDCA